MLFKTKDKEKNKIDIENIKKPRYICFVCTGNTCRSPMACAVFNDLEKKATEKDPGRERRYALSAGIYTTGGESISYNAVKALENAGIESTPDNDYVNHLSRRIDMETISMCEKVVGISGAHAMDLMMTYPTFCDKICCFSRDVVDPFGGDISVYENCLSEIKELIVSMFFEGIEP